MKIELLYFEDCPCWTDTRKLVEEVLAEKGIDAEIELVNVESNEQAQRVRFIGSPSLRVDGKDIEPGALQVGFNLECRLYWIDGKPVGVPKREWIEAALSKGTALDPPAAARR